MKLTLRCPFATQTKESPHRRCPNTATWSVEARRSPMHQNALVIYDDEAHCSGSERLPEDDPLGAHNGVVVEGTDELVVIVGREGFPAEVPA